MYDDAFLERKLSERRGNHSLRTLRLPGNGVDFCSNDYLGIATNHLLIAGDKACRTGATGSRLLSGNTALHEETERFIAAFHQAPAALLFNSGYDANTGLLSCVPQKGDTILYDQLCHASIRDGIRLSFANAFSFAHNDIGDLEKKIAGKQGTVFIVTESVFSMDGDICPLQDLVNIAQKNNAHLIVDEAHATGVMGEQGEGLAQQLQLHENIFARVHTFGKACGCHGAVVLGSEALRLYLLNFARSLVFSTALPGYAIAHIQSSYRLFPQMKAERAHLHSLAAQFQAADIAFEKIVSQTPVQGIIIPGNEAVKKTADQLQENGFDVRPIRYPTVPKGRERLRIVLHAFNTVQQLNELIYLLNK